MSTTVSHCWSLQLPIPGAERARHARSGGGKQAKKRAKQNRKRERQLQLQRGSEPEPPRKLRARGRAAVKTEAGEDTYNLRRRLWQK